MNATLYVGDAKETLRTLPESSVQCCVTSPPYWGLRDYGEDGQLGLEETPEEYVQKLVSVFDEVRRVLRPDGTLWLNLGDSYAANRSNQVSDQKHPSHDYNNANSQSVPQGLKEKDLTGIPWRVAFALQDAGWWLRSDIIWAKGNPMPESVTDRPTSSHEHIFLLSPSKQYFYDADAIREDSVCDAGTAGEWDGNRDLNLPDGETRFSKPNLGGSIDGQRNKRDVWQVNTKPYPDAHFAVYPPELIEPCIKAGTSKKGQCAGCGAPWERVVGRKDVEPDSYKSSRFDTGKTNGHMKDRAQKGERTTRIATDEWKPACDCNADTEPQTVLDPFAGAGTTGVVALAKGRDFIGIDLSGEYCEMAADRIRQDAPLMNNVELTPAPDAGG